MSFKKLIISRVPLPLHPLEVDGKGNSYVLLDGLLTQYDPTGAIIRTSKITTTLNASDFAILEDGGAVVVGRTSAVNFPARRTLQPCNMNLPHDIVPVQWWVMSAAMVVLDAKGNVSNASLLGGGAPAGYGNDSNGIDAIVLDQFGLLHLAGYSTSLDFPTNMDLVLQQPTPSSVFGLSLDLNALPGRNNPSPACLAFAAPFGPVEAPVVPAMPMTIFGSDLGPVTGISP